MKDLSHSLEDFLEAGESKFPEKGRGIGSNGDCACTLTTLHVGYNMKNEEGDIRWDQYGEFKYCKQAYNLSHPLNHHLTVVETISLPIRINYPVITKVKERFGYLPVRWGIMVLNDETDRSRKNIVEWASKELSQ